MHIFLDPLREPQITMFDKTVKTFKDFITIANDNKISFLSLEYELDGEKNAIDVLYYLKEKNMCVPFINIHTRSNEARQSLRKLIKKYSKDSIITFIKEL